MKVSFDIPGIGPRIVLLNWYTEPYKTVDSGLEVHI